MTEQTGNIIETVLDALSHLPHVVKEIETKLNLSDLMNRSNEYQVSNLNSFFFRYLSKFEGTLEVRRRLSSGSPPREWLVDFHQEVIPLLERI